MKYIEFDFDWNPQYLRHSCAVSDYFSVGGGVDHQNDCHNDYFTFTSILFLKADEADHGVARLNEKAKYFERLLQGSLALHECERTWPLSIGREDVPLNCTPTSFTVNSLRKKAFFETEPLAQHAVLAVAVPEYARLLLILQRGNDWVEWYKVIETIGTDYPVPTKKKPNPNTPASLIFDEERLKRFTYTANSPAVSGLDARHGENGMKESSRIEPMTKNEGHQLVHEIVTAYAKEKIKEYKNWI